MKINFKKIASVLASTVMLSSTVALAAAANYPAPFVKGGAADVAVVYGSTALNTDLVAAIDVTADLQAELASQTATSGTSTGATASGGDSVNLASSSQRLYWNSTLNAAKTSVTSSEMPTLLKDGSVADDSGTAYAYTQTVTLGSRPVAYSTSGGDFDDPVLLIDAGYTATSYLYRYKMTFNKNLNISDATNVQGNDVEIMGKTFTIGANSYGYNGADGTTLLYLYGAGESITLNEGEEKTVTIAGKEHTVKVTAITQSTTDRVTVSVDGGSAREIVEGSSSKVGGMEVYAKTVTYSAKESTQNSATLNIGSETLKLSDGSTVAKGSDELSVQNTLITLTEAGDGKLSAIQVDVAMPDTTKDYIKSGETFTDDVFGGLKVQFVGLTPTLDSESRAKVVIDTDNSRNARVTFTSALSGVEKQIVYNHDNDTAESTVTPNLADTADKRIHVVEGQAVAINEYMVINAGDYGRIIKLTSVPTGAFASTSYIQFTDAITGENVFSGNGLTVGTTGNASTNLNGQTYYFKVYNGTALSNVTVTWGASSASDYVGDVTTLFPRIKLKDGGWISILAPALVTRGSTYSLPGLDSLTSYETGQAITWNNTADLPMVSTKFGNVNYTLTNSTIPLAGANGTTSLLYAVSTGGAAEPNCVFNTTYGPALLFQEQKKTTESGNSDNGDVLCVASDFSGSTTPVEMSVATPQATGRWSGMTSWTSDSYQQSAVTRFGTYVKYNTQDNDKVEVLYSADQAFADVLFTSSEAVVEAGSVAGGTVKKLGSVSVSDAEVSSVSGKNLIVVGGSCVNSVAASLLGGALCGADFEAGTTVGAGSFLIETFSRDGGKVATLVAGYNADDTSNAAKYLTTQVVDTTVGKKYVGTSATTASLVTAESTT